MNPNIIPVYWVMYVSYVALFLFFGFPMTYLTNNSLSNLLYQAWRLWIENKLLDLMDPSLREHCNTNQFLRCVNIGLLCVQDEQGDRPTMSNVVTMLDSETLSLQTPKQPTFFMSRDLASTASSSSKPQISMQFQSSSQEGRQCIMKALPYLTFPIRLQALKQKNK